MLFILLQSDRFLTFVNLHRRAEAFTPGGVRSAALPTTWSYSDGSNVHTSALLSLYFPRSFMQLN